MGTNRKPTQEEQQAAAAALQALSEGNVTQAKLLNKLLEMTIEDNNKEAEGK